MQRTGACAGGKTRRSPVSGTLHCTCPLWHSLPCKCDAAMGTHVQAGALGRRLVARAHYGAFGCRAVIGEVKLTEKSSLHGVPDPITARQRVPCCSM